MPTANHPPLAFVVLVSLAVLLGVGVAGAPPVAAQEVERVIRIFDCGFLVTRHPDFPAPDLVGPLGGEAEPVEEEAEEEFVPTLEPEILVEMIKQNIQPDSWHHERNRIKLEDGKLTVVQTPDVQVEIERFLARLRESGMRMVHLVGRAFSVADSHFASIRAHTESSPSGVLLTAEEVRRFLGADAGVKVQELATVSLIAFSGQLVYAGPIKRTRIVKDFDPEIAEEAVVYQPVLGQLLTGTVFEIRPTIVGAGLTLLDVSVAHAAPVGGLTQVETGSGRIDTPMRAVRSSATTLLVPAGRTALLAAGGGADRRTTVFLLEPRIIGGKAGAPVGAAERKGGEARPVRELRVYPTGLLTARIQDRPCPVHVRIDVEIAQAAEVFKSAMGGLDVGIGIEPKDLVELIKTGVEADTWSNTRNRIRAAGDLLVVVQKPPVHEKIAAFLREQRARRGVLIATAVEALAIDAESMETVLPASARAGAPLDRKQREALDAAVAREPGVRRLASALVTGFNRQRVHALSALERPVIAKVDVEVAKKAWAFDPVVRPLVSGLFVDLRPGLVGDGRTIGLDLFTVYSTADPPTPVPFRDGEPQVIHRFATETATLYTSAFVPEGGTAVFVRGPAPGKADHRLVFLVTPRVLRVTGP